MRFRPLLSIILLVSAGFVILLTGSPDEKRVSIYSNAANYSLPIVQRNGIDYVGLLEALEPLGVVSAKTSGSRWKLHYYEVESEFSAGRTRGKIHNSNFDLPAAFLLENGRGLVPLSSLSVLLPRILGGPVTFHEAGRRLFIGNVAVHFTAQITQSTPPSLVLNFTAPVNPVIATGSGRLRMSFFHEAVVSPGSDFLSFGNKVIPSANFEEANGAADLIVNGTTPLMARFSNDGRTITVSPPQAAAQATPAQGAPSQANQVSAGSNVAANATHKYFAVIDASHGGDERGAALNDQLAEKDVTLALARRIRIGLEARGLKTLLLRDGDNTLSVEQRAALTNAARPALYLSVHATSQGPAIRLYTAMLPHTAENRGLFLAWESAQSSFLPLSQAAAGGIATELTAKRLAVRTVPAPLLPLNNIVAAAIAVEVAPASTDISQLASPFYQQTVAEAVATGVADVRDRIEAGR